jgi:hypothetical protein
MSRCVILISRPPRQDSSLSPNVVIVASSPLPKHHTAPLAQGVSQAELRAITPAPLTILARLSRCSVYAERRFLPLGPFFLCDVLVQIARGIGDKCRPEMLLQA